MNSKNENVDIPDGWKVIDGKLQRSIALENYAKGVEHVFVIARIAGEKNHHPDITLSYGEVVVTTFSHDKDKITDRDSELARAINREIAI